MWQSVLAEMWHSVLAETYYAQNKLFKRENKERNQESEGEERVKKWIIFTNKLKVIGYISICTSHLKQHEKA